MSYEYLNMNPHKLDTDDCSARAISVAENISWDKAYRKLSDYARERGLMLSSVQSIESYLDDNYKRFCNYNITVGEFARRYNKGTYLVTMRGHITVIINGVIIDTFDCSNRKMWCAWIVK